MKKILSLVAVLLATLTLAACGGSESSASDHTVHNDADVMFATQMVPHHQQAVAMAKMAALNAESADVKKLAGSIETAQGPEIRTMNGWLKSWGADGNDSMSGMDMSGSSGSMPGMMSKATMDRLQKATGSEFDRLFLRGMIAHHQGALTMAEQEIAQGKSPEAVALAKRIKTSQTAEIARMRRLLES